MTTLAELDALEPSQFVQHLTGIYEHSPWVAERVAGLRPFGSIERLHAALQEAVERAAFDEQLALIRAHPELIGKLAPSETITPESRSEQASAGLDRSSPAQMQQLRELNRIYRERFGFPFIVAVRGLSRDDIVAEITRRTARSPDEEFAQCLLEIGKIARMRLQTLLGPG